jgi:hypothetical protein
MGVVLKVNSLKTVLFLPFACGVLMLSQAGLFVSSTPLLDGFRLIVVAVGCQPFIALAPVSTATNDTSKLRFVASVTVPGLLLLACGIGVAVAAAFVTVAICGFIGIALSVLALVLYGRWFNQSKFDLVPLQKPEFGP